MKIKSDFITNSSSSNFLIHNTNLFEVANFILETWKERYCLSRFVIERPTAISKETIYKILKQSIWDCGSLPEHNFSGINIKFKDITGENNIFFFKKDLWIKEKTYNVFVQTVHDFLVEEISHEIDTEKEKIIINIIEAVHPDWYDSDRILCRNCNYLHLPTLKIINFEDLTF